MDRHSTNHTGAPHIIVRRHPTNPRSSVEAQGAVDPKLLAILMRDAVLNVALKATSVDGAHKRHNQVIQM